jgi:hypothetical protein
MLQSAPTKEKKIEHFNRIMRRVTTVWKGVDGISTPSGDRSSKRFLQSRHFYIQRDGIVNRNLNRILRCCESYQFGLLTRFSDQNPVRIGISVRQGKRLPVAGLDGREVINDILPANSLSLTGDFCALAKEKRPAMQTTLPGPFRSRDRLRSLTRSDQMVTSETSFSSSIGDCDSVPRGMEGPITTASW